MVGDFFNTLVAELHSTSKQKNFHFFYFLFPFFPFLAEFALLKDPGNLFGRSGGKDGAPEGKRGMKRVKIFPLAPSIGEIIYPVHFGTIPFHPCPFQSIEPSP